MPSDGSWLALLAWGAGVAIVAWFWEALEERWLEWQWSRRQRKIQRAWREWYAAHPCKRSHLEPWLGANERKHDKAGRL